jgi:hypothetical protein
MTWPDGGQQLLIGGFYSAGPGNDTPFSEQINSMIMAMRGNYVVSACAPTIGANTDLSVADNHLAVASGTIHVNSTSVVVTGASIDLNAAWATLSSAVDDQSCYVLIYINSSGTISTLQGSNATDGEQEPPETPQDVAVIALVYLNYADSTFDTNDFADWRFFAPDGILKLGGVLVTATGDELNYVDGVTSAIQTQLDAITGNLAIGSGNAQWENCSYNHAPHINLERSGMWYSNSTNSTDIFMSFTLPLPTTRNGLSLFVEEVGVSVKAADASYYINSLIVYGLKASSEDQNIIPSSDQKSQGELEVAFTAIDFSAYKWVVIEIWVVVGGAAADQVKWGTPRLKYYYA